MKTHIALVGGQPIPVYLGIKSQDQVDRLILVHSDQTKEEAGRLAACTPHILDKELVECNPVALEQIETCAKEILEKVKDDEVVLDLTSGTKAWTLVFYKTFMAMEKAQFILVNQNNKVQNLDTYVKSEQTIDKDLRFALYGVCVKSYTPYSDYTEEDKEVCRQVEKVRQSNIISFGHLTSSNRLEEEAGTSQLLKDGSYVEWDVEAQSVDLFLYNYLRHRVEHHVFESPHAVDIVFNNGWFELKTAMEFADHVQGVKDIWMNCEFVALKGEPEKEMPKNEIDIIVDMGSKLLFVECKTKVYEITAIDKFRSAVRNFSGTSSKAIFVVDYMDENNRDLHDMAVGKCKDNNILMFCFSEREKDWSLDSLDDIINDNLKKTNKK